MTGGFPSQRPSNAEHLISHEWDFILSTANVFFQIAHSKKQVYDTVVCSLGMNEQLNSIDLYGRNYFSMP